ncbi:hypothetical protein PLESTF_001901900 [Pleodorina starrii]|nr:hypothetical protein PLESTF_001901900 [Pleodorina starrii]
MGPNPVLDPADDVDQARRELQEAAVRAAAAAEPYGSAGGALGLRLVPSGAESAAAAGSAAEKHPRGDREAEAIERTLRGHKPPPVKVPPPQQPPPPQQQLQLQQQGRGE